MERVEEYAFNSSEVLVESMLGLAVDPR